LHLINEPEGMVDTSQNGGQNVTIVVAEDAEPIRKMVCAMLGQAGYRCLEAGDGREALDLITAAPEAVDLLLTDVIMPHLGGIELSRRVARVKPDIRILFMSGFSDDPIVRSLERARAVFLAKPFTATLLLEKVRSALEAPWQGLPEANSGAGAR
jgi:two-component system, cell cycle sensor histidine kinase and response regulator CckA